MSEKIKTKTTRTPQPNVSFWNVKAPLIQWINDGFKPNRHLHLRGLDDHALRSSFGTANRAEAIHRQNLIRLLVENDDLRELVLSKDLTYEGKLVEIPSNGQRFVDYFDPQRKNAFWSKAGEFITTIESLQAVQHGIINSNPDLVSMAQYLKDEKKRFEDDEAAMGASVVQELLKATSIQGTVTLQLRQDTDLEWCFAIVDKEAVGHRLYALNLPSEGVSIHERWDNKFWRKLGVYDWLMKRAEKRKELEIRRWATPIIVTHCPDEVGRDICAYMNDVLRTNKKSGFPIPRDYQTKLVDLVIRFSYTGEGLRIKVVGVSGTQMVPEAWDKNWASDPQKDTFRYYSQADLDKAHTMRQDIRRRSYITHLLSNFYPELKQWFETNMTEIMSQVGIIIESSSSDYLFKWRQAEAVCKESWPEEYESAQAVRSFVARHMTTLHRVAVIADAFVSRSRAWGLLLSFPEIMEGEKAMLSFEQLWPVDLIGRETSGSKGKPITVSDLRPITALGDLSAGIAMLTGGNGAGKTTTGEELLGVLLDAASGFPVFGKNVRLNLRTVVGSIYLERGDGSTMQLSLVKLAKVVEEVCKHPQNGTFVFWDEAGTGTTASQGELLGMATLSRFKEIGCTVLVNTQIPSLAENAQTHLGAKCFQVDMGHRITSGIGEPDITELAREMGLDETLNLK